MTVINFLPLLFRAIRLKKQRLERQKTATERRQALESKQKEKWKVSHHSECSQGHSFIHSLFIHSLFGKAG